VKPGETLSVAARIHALDGKRGAVLPGTEVEVQTGPDKEPVAPGESSGKVTSDMPLQIGLPNTAPSS
jgi:hypothetical protein